MVDYALGILIRDRWEMTLATLQGLANSKQDNYDLFIIDNGSSKENVDKLKKSIDDLDLNPVSTFFIHDLPISKAWNLFLVNAKHYDYRIKLDNDLEIVDENTKFLDVMREYSDQHGIDLTAIIPLNPGIPFHIMWIEACRVKQNGMSYLHGGCMMITKKCFDKIGYFDERLNRRMDIEYSHRTLRNEMKIGYPPNYWLKHLGANKNTVGRSEAVRRYEEALRISKEEGNMTGRVSSMWETDAKYRIKSQADTSEHWVRS